MKWIAALSLFILQLVYPTLSYVASGQIQTPAQQHRSNPLWPLRSSAQNNQNGETSKDPDDEYKANLFERTVRKVTRNKNYKFGDLAKSAGKVSARTFETAVRTVTNDDDYQFGDYSKKVLSTGTGAFEGAVRSITQNEEYQFGVSRLCVMSSGLLHSLSLIICISFSLTKDLTRGAVSSVKSSTGKILTYSEKTLSLLNDANIHELVELLNFFWCNSMSFEEQREAFVVFVYLGAIVVLAYNFISNLMNGAVFAAAWYKVSVATQLSPLSVWPTFLQTKATLDLIFGGPFLPVRVAATIPWFFKYRKLVVGTAYLSPLREKFPILNRIKSLLLSWIVVNLALIGGITYGLVKCAALRSGVPIFPIA
jgi:hypothetical protein